MDSAAWAGLIGAIGGAIIGSAATLITPIVTQNIRERHKRRKSAINHVRELRNLSREAIEEAQELLPAVLTPNPPTPYDARGMVKTIKFDSGRLHGEVPYAAFKVGRYYSHDLGLGSSSESLQNLREKLLAVRKEYWTCVNHQQYLSGRELANYQDSERRKIEALIAATITAREEWKDNVERTVQKFGGVFPRWRQTAG